MNINWPPYSPDLNLCESILWGHLNDEMYSKNPKVISELKIAIQAQIEAIDILYLRVIKKILMRLHHAAARNDRHSEHVIN